MALPKTRGRAFVISSPSGGGKTTVAARLLRALPRLTRSVSVTTRPMRRGERQGRDYDFVSPAAFHRLRRAGQLLEWARVHGAYYGTPKRPVLQALAGGRDVVLSIDVQGARQVRRALGRRAALIFLLPPSMDHLRRRLVGRKTETPAAIRRRLAAAQRELSCAAWYDYTVINDRLTRAIQDIRAIVDAHGRIVAVGAQRLDNTGGSSAWHRCRSKSS
ncbi:MAG: guanylate kinase [Candidatus Omnitrophica bacterium]|nr:guanylate kinase [Candidatus Omnitrophota bacterium]